MLRHLRAAAAEERETHKYNNRTYRLQNSTEAFPIVSSPNLVVCELRMGMWYAESVVFKFGKSNFPQIANEAAIDLHASLSNLI